MKSYINKIKLYVFSHKVISIIILIAILLLGYWGYKKFTSTAGEIRYITAKVEKGTIIISVFGSGQVSSLNQIDIKSKVSGDITYIGAQSGKKVGIGALIAKIDARDAQKSVRDAEISLETAKISLKKLKIEKSNENLNADLIKAYDDGFSAVSNAFLDLPLTVTGLEEMFANENLTDNAARISGGTAQDYRDTAETLYYNANKAFETNRIYYRTLDRNSPREDVEKIINQTYETTKLVADATKNLRNYVDFMAEDSNSSSGFSSSQNTLSAYENTINGHLDNLFLVKTNIKDYKDAFLNSDLDIQSSELSVKQKENALQDAKDKLADYFIRAPFAGTIAIVNIKKGDSVSTSTVVATLMTDKQIAEISINEVDVAKIKIGEKATLTFDAVSDLAISGVVTEIDSVGTVSQGVVTYIVKISFDTQDERVKTGMSVNTEITTDIKQDVLVVPNSALKSQAGKSYIEKFSTPLIPPAKGLIGSISKIAPNKIIVGVGLSNDGESEIIFGIKEGDEIVTRTILPTAVTTTAPNIFGGGTGSRGTSTSR